DPVPVPDPVPVQAADWTLEGGWAAAEQEGGGALRYSGASESFASYNALMDGASGFAVGYTLRAEDDTQVTSASVSLRLLTNPERWVFIRVKLVNGGCLVEGQVLDNGQWSTVFTSGSSWLSGADGEVGVLLSRAEGADTLLFRVCAADGTELYRTTLADDRLAGGAFYDNDLKFVLGADGGSGAFTISGLGGLPQPADTDRRDTPFEQILVLGDSISAGVGASDPAATAWPALLAEQIARLQGSEPEMINRAVSASVVTPLCPAYEFSAKPAARERVEADLAGCSPDLLLVAYGINDLRGGTPVDVFIEEYRAYLTDLREEAGPDTLVALTSLFAIDASGYRWDGEWGKATPENHAAYNTAIRELAEELDALYIDVYSAEAAAGWFLDDGLHPNDAGHRVLADAVLAGLARHCSVLSGAEAPRTAGQPAKALTDAQWQAARAALLAADTAEELEQALANGRLGLDLGFFDTLSAGQREEALALLLDAEDKAGWDSPAALQRAVDAAAVAYRVENPNQNRLPEAVTRLSRVVVVGDSISVGLNASNQTETAWVPQVIQRLEAIQNQPITLINKAISGTQMTNDSGPDGRDPAAPKRVQSDILDNDPDLLLIAYGINDLNAGVTVETFTEAYRGYLTAIREGTRPEMGLVLVGLTPLSDGRSAQGIAAYNRAIRSLAEEFGAAYADVYGAMRGTEWLLDDGLHPTDGGHALMAGRITQTVLANFRLLPAEGPGENPGEEPGENPGGDPDGQPGGPDEGMDPSPDDPGVPEDPDSPGQPGGSAENPQTGAAAPLSALLAAAASAAGLIVSRRRKGR
ncbi:MAG TPA: SGNH/GDSL hydrolase family protein, partial [Firmicutes bacterium]|nr:SGNH/GDSL hydrolase family protein [Bacillota bacterium]